MKKVFLLCALVCAGQMYGMESQQSYMEELSPEVKVMIIQALHNTYNPKLNSEENLKSIINAIKAMSEVNTELNAIVNYMYGNQKKFTELVHILATSLRLERKILLKNLILRLQKNI